MSDLQPMGAVLQFNCEERRLFWDFGVIEKVQELYGEHPYFAITKMLWEGKAEDGTLLQHYQAKPLLDLAEIHEMVVMSTHETMFHAVNALLDAGLQDAEWE